MTTEDKSKGGEGDEGKKGGEGSGDTVESLRAELAARDEKINTLTTGFSGLETKLNKVTGELETIKKTGKQKTKEKADGGDPDAIKELEKTLREEIEGQYAEKESGYKETVSSLTNKVKKLTISDAARKEATELGFNKDMIDLIVEQVEKSADLDGDKVVIKDSAGTIRMSSDQRGQPLSIKELLGEFAKKYASAMEPKFRSGTAPGHKEEGAKGSGGSQDLPSGFFGWNPEQRQEYWNKNPDARKAFLGNSSFEKKPQ